MTTGSFPLMDIARRHGADYGDVLLVADDWRRAFDMAEYVPARGDEAYRALRRLAVALGDFHYGVLCNEIRYHAYERWGRA